MVIHILQIKLGVIGGRGGRVDEGGEGRRTWEGGLLGEVRFGERGEWELWKNSFPL
jgi:hypothetical protein